MARVIELNVIPFTSQPKELTGPEIKAIQQLIEARKKTKREPLTATKVRVTTGLQTLSEPDAVEIIDAIKQLSALLFELHCQKQAICIDNQQVVCLTNENKAA